MVRSVTALCGLQQDGCQLETLGRPRDLTLYNMSVNAQTAAAKLTPNGIVASKIRFLLGEAFGDLTPQVGIV